MMTAVRYFCCVFLVSACGTIEKETASRVFQFESDVSLKQSLGQDVFAQSTVNLVQEDEAGFMRTFCSGAVIAKNAIITAASCLEPSEKKMAKLKAIVNIGGQQKQYAVERISVHPNWNIAPEKSNGVDLAMIFIREENLLSLVPFAHQLEPDQPIVVAGFGVNKIVYNKKGEPRYDTGTLGTFNNTDFNLENGKKAVDSECQIHINSARPYEGITPGDDGAPIYSLRSNHVEMAGVVSHAFINDIGTAADRVLGTRLSCYVSWIQDSLR